MVIIIGMASPVSDFMSSGESARKSPSSLLLLPFSHSTQASFALRIEINKMSYGASFACTGNAEPIQTPGDLVDPKVQPLYVGTTVPPLPKFKEAGSEPRASWVQYLPSADPVRI